MATRVIDRLVNSDYVLIELSDVSGDSSKSILVVHPNFNPEEGSNIATFSQNNKRNVSEHIRSNASQKDIKMAIEIIPENSMKYF